MSEQSLSARIRDRALEVGFDAVGIAPATAVPGDLLQLWLARKYHGSMDYMARTAEKRRDPREVLPSVRSIISVGLNYLHPYQLPYHRSDLAVISRYASGTDYHEVMEKKLAELGAFIQELQPGGETRFYVDTGPVMDKHWAAQAGIGWLGKHTNLLSRDLGSWFFIGEILVELDLEYDAPVEDLCGSCTSCIDSCPTEAIVEPYVLDGRKCISYLTIELRGEIPTAHRESVRNLVFGCDICQDVCPWNNTSLVSSQPDLGPREENQSPSLKELARLSPEDFQKRFQKSPVKRAKWKGLMRNVAVAMGNSRDPEMISDLVRLAGLGDELIREHSIWALRQIGTQEALRAAERAEPGYLKDAPG